MQGENDCVQFRRLPYGCTMAAELVRLLQTTELAMADSRFNALLNELLSYLDEHYFSLRGSCFLSNEDVAFFAPEQEEGRAFVWSDYIEALLKGGKQS